MRQPGMTPGAAQRVSQVAALPRDLPRIQQQRRQRDQRHDAAAQAEPRAGGRLVETARDGTEHPWGTVSAWEPGRRVAFSWHPGRDPASAQWIEVAFRANPAGTRVTLVHGGWEALGERATASREAYRNGWPTVFGQRYRDFCVAARAS